MSRLDVAPDSVEQIDSFRGEFPIRVVLADDHAGMRRSLRCVLDGCGTVEVVAEAHDIPGALLGVRLHKPDVLVLDAHMPGGSCIEAVRELTDKAPGTRIVLLTMDASQVLAQQVLSAGASAYLLKEFADDELPGAVRAAWRGEDYLSPHAVTGPLPLQHAHRDDPLTAREMEILRRIALGHTSAEIAAQLYISPRTVETHRARIHSKVGLGTRAELVRYALGRGLLSV